uniref:Disease resistance protein Roq1-like winged-helix domain-containing protein n=1 Tax=Salix viminalis TaxID=40686 RepID=A0A6N2L363_SALVM
MDKREQLEALMGERCWFGNGSKIIVVTKNKHLLTEVEVDGMYHAMELDRDQSLQLFSLHAFRETRPAKDYEELSEKVVDYCEGLPLALKILGSHLSTRDKAGWKIDIAHWRNIPHDDIQAKLREIFLDIACFFVGKDKDYVANIVGARYGCHPEVAFRALIGRSLITINNRLWMHDIVRNMGRAIIRQRSHNHPGNCSRTVLQKDAYIVLSKEMGTKAVEGLTLDVQGSFSTKSFTKMRRLQLLQIIGAHLARSYSLLPRELIWLSWLECPLKSLPPNSHLIELVILDMQKSKVRKLWKGTKILNKLKILNLSYPSALLKHQTSEDSLLKSLQTLNVVECSQLEKLPENLGDLESLTKLFAKGTAIKPLPTSARYLKKLTKLSLGGYKNVFCSPNPPSISRFSSLKELDLSYAGLSDAISSIDLGSLSFLEDLDLSGNGFFNLPSGISRLPKLQCFTGERCKNLLSISELPSSVLFLSINDCASIERVSAPLQHEEPPCLSVIGCRNLIEIQGMEFAGNSWDYAKVNVMTFTLLVVRYQNGSAIVEKDLHYHFICPQFQSRTVINSKPWSASTNEATPKTSLPFYGICFATLKNKSNGIELFHTSATITFGRNSTKHSWIHRVSLTGLEESLQGVEELELNVQVSLDNGRKCWVEKCGVHLIMEKSKADSDIHGEKWNHACSRPFNY